MAQYAGTVSNFYTNEFANSVSVSDIAQKYLGESTHPIDRMSLMQIIMQLSSAAADMMYVNAPTWNGRRVLQW